MKKITKILLSILLLSTFTISYANNCCCSCNSCCNNCSWNSCCNSCCNSCNNNCCCKSSKSCCSCECRVQSRTTFVVRPHFQVGSPEYLTGFRDRMDARGEDGHGGAFQIVPFGGRSTKAGKLASFFTPDCKTCLAVKIDNTENKTDLITQHFNVNFQEADGAEEPPFESTICFCPRVKTFGLGLTYRQNLSKFRDDYDPNERHWWFEISTPITRVETTMGLSECITSTATCGVAADVVEGLDQKFYTNMTSALNQSAWCYGKINGCCECAKTRLGDITLMIGYETAKCENLILEGFVGILAPTGNKRCANYVFEPIVGHAKHWGIVKGWHLRVDVWEDEEEGRKLEIAHDSNGMYLFKKVEKRSFDLKCKPWSRYMEVYANQAQAQTAYDLNEAGNIEAATLLSSPGINYFTQCMCVKPKLSFSTNTAMIYSGNKFRGELGVNFYCKQTECVELCCWNEGPALKANTGSGATNRFRTINVNAGVPPTGTGPDDRPAHDQVDGILAFANYDNNLIKLCDIDLESATHEGYFSYTFYGSLGARWDEREYPLFIDFGSSYEYGCENTVLNRWALWAKFGASF